MSGDPRALEERMVAAVGLKNMCDACIEGVASVFATAFNGALRSPMPADFEALLNKLDQDRGPR